MADKITPEQRSFIMSRIRGKDTKPELLLRSLLHRAGFRFRLHRRDLAGSPDLVLARYNTAIFVNGCFWHQHRSCRKARLPSSRREYWVPKLAANASRDRRNAAKLRRQGWSVLTVWECQLERDADLVVARISRRIAG